MLARMSSGPNNPYESPTSQRPARPSSGNESPLSTWLRAGRADPLGSAILVVLIFDTVFRAIAAVQLLGYANLIGFFYSTAKFIAYGGGIVGNVAILNWRKWGAAVGIGAAAIGFWLVAIDAWSLFHVAFGPGLLAPGNFFLVRNTFKTMCRGAWLAIYVVALVLLLQQIERRGR